MQFEDKIRSLAMALPLSVTSWIRSPARNAKVGGAANSLHMVGLAVDVVLDDPKDIRQLEILAERLKLWVLIEDDHVHLQEVPA